MRARRYFVVRLVGDPGWRPAGAAYEVQVLDSHGRGAVVVHYASDGGVVGASAANGRQMDAASVRIPEAVLDAARRQIPGEGDYVGEDGRSVPPF